MQTVPVSMRLNQPAAAYVIQGMMAEAGLPAQSFTAQIQQTVALLYRWGGMIAVQAGSPLEQRLMQAARQAQAQTQVAAPTIPAVPVVIAQAPVSAAASGIVPAVPVPVAPPPASPEIVTQGQPIVDVQPLG